MEEFRKKRCAGWRALLCTVCVIFALFSIAADVYAAETASIAGTSVSGEKGETVTVCFDLKNNPGVWGAKCEISYDASVLTLKAVAAGSVFTSSEIIMGEDLKQNPFVFLATGNAIADKKNNGTLVKATFTIHPDAKLGDYAVGIKVLQFINTNGEDVPCSAYGAKITVANCLHRNTELKNVVQATEEKEGYSGDTYCKKCQVLIKKGAATPKLESTCKHMAHAKAVITEATCEKAGLAKISCADCGKELSEEAIPATGHTEAAPKNFKAATTTEEGYTGDIHCQDCDKLLKTGTAIPKIKVHVFSMTVQTEDTYLREAPAGLVFVSDADLDTFVRVEINGIILDAQSYTLESGSTKVTLKPEFLETLSDGKHTITIVSDAGTASAQFYVATEKEESPAASYRVLLIVTIIALVVMVGCVAVTVYIVLNNKKNGRYIRHGEQ